MSDVIYTIGFTQKTAERFFDLLRSAKVEKVVDVRLNNSSQLAGFAKRQDLIFFLREICHAEYVHLPDLAPTQQMLDAYKKTGGSWSVYESDFLALMSDRRVEKSVSRELVSDACFLCSEHDAHFCHRRLVAEYLSRKWEVPLTIKHLK